MRVYESDSAELNCAINSRISPGVSISYSWQKEGEVLPGEELQKLIVSLNTKIKESLRERYDCIATPSDDRLKGISV